MHQDLHGLGIYLHTLLICGLSVRSKVNKHANLAKKIARQCGKVEGRVEDLPMKAMSTTPGASAVCSPCQSILLDPHIELVFGILSEMEVRFRNALQDVVVVLRHAEDAW
jgi:hypothetical protein